MPFAAGCAVCGADLDTTRFDRGPSPLQRLGSWVVALGYRPTVSVPTMIAVVVLIYLALTVL